jgi:hypothetical protein
MLTEVTYSSLSYNNYHRNFLSIVSLAGKWMAVGLPKIIFAQPAKQTRGA